MAAFQRDQRRALCTGICLNAPPDLVPPGKWPFISNVRSYQAGTLVARMGTALITGGAIGAGLVHSITRLNDPTPFAAAPFWRVFGAGAAIRAGQTSYPQIDTGYSTNPLTFVTVAPVQAPNPYVYVGDSSRMRKFDVNSHVFPVGIAPPRLEPSAVLSPLPANFIDGAANATWWIGMGTPSSAPAVIFRINTTVADIIYDSGTTGNASVAPNSMDGINTDAIVNIGGVEAVMVQQVCPAIVSTTIASIIYDAGVSGLCTIQPVASLTTGQTSTPGFNDYAARAGAYGKQTGSVNADASAGAIEQQLPAEFPTTVDVPGYMPTDNRGASRNGQPVPTSPIRRIDFPVNCLIMVNATEVVRVLSVAVGPDGIQSFRAFAAGTYSAGQSLVGIDSFRINTVANYAAGATLQAAALENTITPSGTPPGATGGITTVPPFAPINNPAIQGNGVATLPDDDFHISVRLSDCTVITAIRAYLDVDAATNDFTRNYYFYEWRANDIIAAIQAANGDTTSTLMQVRPGVVANVQLNATQTVSGAQQPLTEGGPTQDAATSQALAIGNNQWLELHCKVGDLLRVGTDPSRSLANVIEAQISVQMIGANPITVDYGAIFLTGGNNPDCGYTGAPRVYAYRYRSSITGARSNPSPAVRGGVIPRRQSVGLTGVQSSDGQVDLVDWFVIEGPTGVLDRMTYLGTNLNSNPPTFLDNYAASRVVGGPTLDYDIFQPWATPDKARTMTVDVAGTAVKRTGGTDTFNTSWAPGSIIIIGGQACTLRAQPQSTSFLEINENAGSLSGVTAVLTEPTLLGQPMRGLWGPDVDNVFYGCGDPTNPGFLYWTFPNDPDRHSDAQGVQVTSGSDRLQNGFIYDDRPYVASSDNLYAIVPSADGRGRQAVITPCGKGFWTPWFFVVAPEGIYFGTKDGIFLTAGGSVAQSITDADLYPLFPHDGTVGVAVNGVLPPDFSQTNRLKLSFVDGWIYFDYLDTGSASRTLAYRTIDQSWWFDTYANGVSARLSSGGSGVYEELIGATNGSVYSPSGFNDAGTPIAAKGKYIANQQDARRQKLYRDCMVEAIIPSTMNVTLTLSNDVSTIGTTAIGGSANRLEYPVDVIPKRGAFGLNLGVLLEWAPSAVNAPQVFLTDVAYQDEVESTTSWLSGPTTFGLSGYLQAMGAYICYVSNTDLNLSVIVDDVLVDYSTVLPSSGGVYKKIFVWLKTIKGLTYQLGLQSTASFMVFDKDIEFFVQPWGQPGGYKLIRPF